MRETKTCWANNSPEPVGAGSSAFAGHVTVPAWLSLGLGITRAMTPKDELNALLSDAIGMALRLVEKHGSHIPFCMAVTASGERMSIAADDTKLPGVDALLAGVRQHIHDALRERRYRAVALARNVEYQSARDGSPTDAVQVTLDHEQGSPVTCYLPYQKVRGAVIPGELFAVKPEESFFTHDA